MSEEPNYWLELFDSDSPRIRRWNRCWTDWLDSIRERRAAEVKSLLASKLGRTRSIEARNLSYDGLARSKEGRTGGTKSRSID